MKAPQFLIAGELHRWCQKCGKFHALTQFESNKRSCVPSLQRHNEKQKRLRVRKQAAAAAAVAASTTATAAPSPCASFSQGDAPIEVSITRAGSDASEGTLGPPPMSLTPSTNSSAAVIVEPLPPPPLVLMLDDMSVAVEASGLPPLATDAAPWAAMPLPSPACAELEIEEFLAELMPEADMGLDIDLSDLDDGSLWGGVSAAAAPAALDWAFAQF